MSNSQIRLARLANENSEDLEIIAQAQARINTREKDAQLLKAQILVEKCLQDGSLPDRPFTRLRKDVALRNTEAVKCQLCEHKPDDALLSACGHLYCEECWSKVRPGRCNFRPCGRRLKKGVEVEETLYGAICMMLKVSFTHDDETEFDSSDDEKRLSAPRSSKQCGGATEQSRSRLSQLRSLLFESFGSQSDENLSEDDGFDNRSQRSIGYDDDGNSFVSDDESIDMTANFNFREDETSSDDSERDMSMGSEEDD